MYRVGSILIVAALLIGCSKSTENSTPVAKSGVSKTTKSKKTVETVEPPYAITEAMEIAAEDEFMALEMDFHNSINAMENKPKELAAKHLEFAAKYLEFAKKHAGTESEFIAIQFAIANGDEGMAQTAMDIVGDRFINDIRLNDMLESFEMIASPPKQIHEDFLNRIVKRTTDRNLKGGANFAKAKILSSVVKMRSMFDGADDLDPDTKTMLAYVLKDHGDLNGKLEKMYEEIGKEYSDVEFGNKTIGELVESELKLFKDSQVGKTAPDIEGVDLDGKPFKLSDYKGKVVMLDFWGDW